MKLFVAAIRETVHYWFNFIPVQVHF